ncbi:hypothetical protein ABZ552_15150, partial [Nocardia sp. NPDC019219]|uniref:hypothetical protein n=1 Tax=Nocardia sp. NPDC019219 TaxID=3154590 RepID=UPI0033E4F1FC
ENLAKQSPAGKLADKKCPTLHTGSGRAGTKKHLALTFIDTLLSSQRTHAHTFTPDSPELQ